MRLRRSLLQLQSANQRVDELEKNSRRTEYEREKDGNNTARAFLHSFGTAAMAAAARDSAALRSLDELSECSRSDTKDLSFSPYCHRPFCWSAQCTFTSPTTKYVSFTYEAVTRRCLLPSLLLILLLTYTYNIFMHIQTTEICNRIRCNHAFSPIHRLTITLKVSNSRIRLLNLVSSSISQNR